MTPDKLRARCEQWVEQQDRDWSGVLANVESLCREMITEGLERAAVEVSFHAYAKDHAIWCRQEAQRVKEDVWITEKAAQEDGCRVDAGRIEEAQRVKEGL